jgi:uncharacterized membrane protein
MFDVPDPFHAAVVHFPIVFIFVGTVLGFMSIFTRRGALPQFTALFLLLAAGSAQYAVMTGEDQEKSVLAHKPAAKALIENHALWGERTRTVAAISAASALLALAFFRSRRFRRALATVTTIVATGACLCVIATGERGGEMVYQHGVGLLADDSAASPTPAANSSGAPQANSGSPIASPSPALHE